MFFSFAVKSSLKYFCSTILFSMQSQAQHKTSNLNSNMKVSADFQTSHHDSHYYQRSKQPSKLYASQNVSQSLKHLKAKMSQIEKIVKKSSQETEKSSQLMVKTDSIDSFHLRKTAPFEHYHEESPASIKSAKLPSRCQYLLAKAGEIIKRSQNISERLQLSESQQLPAAKDKYNSFLNTSQPNISFSGVSYSYSPSFKKNNHKTTVESLKIQDKSQANRFEKTHKFRVKTEIENQLQPSSFLTLQKVKVYAKQSLNKKDRSLKDDFQFLKQLGKGKFGEVYLCRHIETGFLVAIKKVSKQNLISYNMVSRFTQQIYLHSKLDHPNIVKFYGFYQEKDNICLVLEYLSGGTLFDFQNNKGTFTIKEAAGFLREVIGALTYLHDKHIAHRDLKPENIVLSQTGMAKLCDFGWSTLIQSLRTTFCGTLDYAPPEILQKKQYDWSVDVWCLGILTYELLIGHAPFQNEDRQKVMQGIINVDKAQLPGLNTLPQQARVFITALLQKDPKSRPKITELLNFSLFIEGNKRSSKPLE